VNEITNVKERAWTQGAKFMLDSKIQNALNEQINAEMFSAYLYLAMVAYFNDLGLSGFAVWMTSQAQEEMVHAMKFFNYIVERGGRIELLQIEKPQAEWDSPIAAFQDAYKHEQYITGRINDLVNLAIEIKDHATNQMLQWFVEEQVEEEASADEVVQKLAYVQDAPGGIYMIDKELGARVPLFTMPVRE